jgi:hypothetical protein
VLAAFISRALTASCNIPKVIHLHTIVMFILPPIFIPQAVANKTLYKCVFFKKFFPYATVVNV